MNSETRLSTELGIRDALAVGLAIPLRVYDTSIRYLGPGGQPVSIENADLHHRNETLTGIGDPWLTVRTRRIAGRFSFGARVGVTVPLGRTEPDPFELGDMGLRHEHSQFGTGTFEPILGADLARSFGPVSLDLSVLTLQSYYANKHGYQAGDRYGASAGIASALGTTHFRVRGMAELQGETAERWHGMVRTDEGNTGRVDVLAGVEATYLWGDWHVSASVRMPVYTHVKGGQLDVAGFAGISIGTHVHLFEERAHRHAPASVAPSTGKLTVVDFWATWCKPCGELDHLLGELVARHPDDVVVKKVDMTNETPPFTLPHVEVYGRDGKLLFARSAGPAAIIGEIEQALTGPRKVPVVPAGARRIAIEASDKGYTPDRIEITHGEPVVLVFTRKTDNTCATDVHLALPDGTRVDEELPLGTPVEVPLLIDRTGEITFACGMDMFRGTIVVR